MSSSYLLLVFLLLSAANALRPYRHVDILNEKEEGDDDAPSSDHREPQDPDHDKVQELYFTQVLDHFDPLNLKTYQQRYFYSDRYVAASSSSKTKNVTFLCVGGEGPGFTTSVLVDSVHCTGDMLELANKLYEKFDMNVHLYALEHRYYGKSYPTFENDESPVATKNLRYLSSRQALEDLAHFVQTKQTSEQEDSPMPWVTFGGSYPGYMAANARIKHPHLIHAAVSNSAPLDLQVDFPGYNERVGWDLKYEKIGGSQQCFDIVKSGHQQAVAMLDEDPAKLGELFHVCEAETGILKKKENQNLLLGDGLIEIYAQGNDPSCDDSDLCNIQRLCDYMVRAIESNTDNPPSALDVLVDVANKQRGDDSDCRSVDFEAMLDELAKPVVKGFGWRSWLWQTCTEVGFYQTCTQETCPYASHFHTVDQDLAICQAAYNITNVNENVQATRDYYGGLDISAGSRVLSVNGDVDPWSVLGLHTSPKYSLPVEIVAGASHHFWTHQVLETDSPEIQQIREYIYSVVMEWIGVDTAPNISTKRTQVLRG
jgi:serine protease 16